MARIAPKDLGEAVAAAKAGDLLELEGGEHVGQVVIDKPLVIEGRGASTWLGNRTGPVLIIRSQGVELRDLHIEMTGDLEHPAILAEGNCEPILRSVAIRRGELQVEGPLLRFAAPPAIRLRELDAEGASASAVEDGAAAAAAIAVPPENAKISLSPRTVTSLSLPPPPPQPAPSALAAAAAGPAMPPAVALARTAPPAARSGATPMAPVPAPAATKAGGSPLSSLASWASSQPRRARRYALAGLGVLGLGLISLIAMSGERTSGAGAVGAEASSSRKSTGAAAEAASAASSAPPSAAPGAASAAEASSSSPDPEPPPPAELRANSNLRLGVEVVGWSQDEASFLVEIGYGRDSSIPPRWRVRALVDAASERVLRWQDVSVPPARVIAGEDESPPWSTDPEPIQTDGFQRGQVIEPAQLEVRWCGNRRSARFPASARARDRELELSWAASGAQLPAVTCRQGDFGQVLLQVKGSPWRLMRFLPWKGNLSTVRVHSSPSGRRAVVVASFHLGDKIAARFYSRLLGPQIHIVSSNPELRSQALGLLGAPGLFMSENARAPISGASRIVVRAGDEDALRIARSLQERLQAKLGLGAIEEVKLDRAASAISSSYLWGDVLIVLK
jgi:hypothetical protein